MKRSIDETAERFDAFSEDYDEERATAAVDTATAIVDRVQQMVTGDEHVLDIGAGTGAVTLSIAGDVDHVYAVDISDGMRSQAREKATDEGIDTVTFGYGTFREPAAELDLPPLDMVVSNFAMHHLADTEKATAIETIADHLVDGGRFILGDVIIFDEADVSVEHYDPTVDDPATIEYLISALDERGFDAEFEQVGPMAGIIDARKRT